MNILKTIKQDLTDGEALASLGLVWRSYAFWLLFGALAGWVYCACAAQSINTLGGAVVLWVFSVLLAAIAVADAKTYIVPDILVYPLALLAIIYVPTNPVSMFFGAVILGGMFYLVKVLSEKATGQDALGWGDVKLVTALGLWVGIPGIVPFLLTASLSAVIVVFGLRLWRAKTPLVPYAPFLAFGGWAAYAYGFYMNNWLIDLRQNILETF